MSQYKILKIVSDTVSEIVILRYKQLMNLVFTFMTAHIYKKIDNVQIQKATDYMQHQCRNKNKSLQEN